MTSTTRRIFLLASAALSFGRASAHSVWIEPQDGKLLVRFGEVGEKYEKSPGYLDKLELPAATDQKGGRLAVEKGADFFLLKDTAPAAPSVASTAFPVMEKPATDTKPASARWPHFYARWHVAGTEITAPVSTLDIVPAKEAGKATVYFKGKPLPKAELTLIQPDGKEVDLTADAEGLVKFTPVGKGLHVLAVAGYSETADGIYQDKAYTIISHNSSVAWIE